MSLPQGSEEMPSSPPPSYPEGPDVLTALCSSQPDAEDQLVFEAGDTVRVVERNSDGWWRVKHERSGVIGLVPVKAFSSSSWHSLITPTGLQADVGDGWTMNASETEFDEKTYRAERLSSKVENFIVSSSPPPDHKRDQEPGPPFPAEESPSEPQTHHYVPPLSPAPSPKQEARLDGLGEELSQEANVWPMYVNAAAAFDTEMIDGWNKNLDVLLLFASLFSAVVTSFVIQSASLLQNNYTQVNALLTAHILAALTNASSASWMDSVPTPDQILAFEIPLVAQVVNVVWYAALSLSLSSVLVSMLAKQWLGAYLADQKADPHLKACERQRRFDGLQKWSLPHIMVLLSGMLHVSLFLFLVGLILYTWSLQAVSIALCVILGILFVIYVTSGALAVFNPDCPYSTPTTSFIRSRATIIQKSKTPPRELLATRAMMWLATVDSPSYVSAALQSMAGLRRNFPGYDKDRVESIARLALERLRGCFVVDWKSNGTSYRFRDDASLQTASSYARTLTNFIDDSRSPPGAFAAIMADRALPTMLRQLGSCSNSSVALIAHCNYQRLLHRQEVTQFELAKPHNGSGDLGERMDFVRGKPAVDNMHQILTLLEDHIEGDVILHGVAIEIAIETMGFAPLPWVYAVITDEIAVEDMLLPLLNMHRKMQDGLAKIRRAMASTLTIFAAVHESVRHPDSRDDISNGFKTALDAASAINHERDDEPETRHMLLGGLSSFIRTYMGTSEPLRDLLMEVFLHECDLRPGTEGPSYSDKGAVAALLPLLLVPSLDSGAKWSIATRVQEYAQSAVSGFDIPEHSVLYYATPRDPFPPDAVSILFTVLTEQKFQTSPWLKKVSTSLYLLTVGSTHRGKLLAEAPTMMQLIQQSRSEEVASDLFWTFTVFLRHAARNSDSSTLIMVAYAGALSTFDYHRARVGLTPGDLHAWIEILPKLPIVSSETRTRAELLESIHASIYNQDSEEVQRAIHMREPLYQASPAAHPHIGGIRSAVPSPGSPMVLYNCTPSASQSSPPARIMLSGRI